MVISIVQSWTSHMMLDSLEYGNVQLNFSRDRSTKFDTGVVYLWAAQEYKGKVLLFIESVQALTARKDCLGYTVQCSVHIYLG